jgi:hypothetical protein
VGQAARQGDELGDMQMIENVLLMAALMALGVGITAALLAGFVYWMEIQSD